MKAFNITKSGIKEDVTLSYKHLLV